MLLQSKYRCLSPHTEMNCCMYAETPVWSFSIYSLSLVKGSQSLFSFSKKSHSVILSQLYSYEDQTAEIIDPRFYERLDWNGSKKTRDLQDGSIYILNVTFNDTGTYQCIFSRILMYPNYEFQTNASKTIVINVVPRRKDRGEGCCTVLFQWGGGKLN